VVVGRFIAVDHLKAINARDPPNGGGHEDRTLKEYKAMGCELNADLRIHEKAGLNVFGRTRDFSRRVQRHTNCRPLEVSELAKLPS